jgi:hypothetical protein
MEDSIAPLPEDVATKLNPLLFELQKIALRALQEPIATIFTRFEDYFSHQMTMANRLEGNYASVKDLSLISTKAKGDLFEVLAQQYLKNIWNCQDVWLLSEIPENIRSYLRLGKQDVGIDLVARKGASWLAVQVKWRSDKQKKVTWKQLSTFQALCERTGPPEGWRKRVVITSCQGVIRKGGKQEQDCSVCSRAWHNLTPSQWYQILEIQGNKLEENSSVIKNLDQMREARLLRFSQN